MSQPIYDYPPPLAAGVSASGVQPALDMRSKADYGYLWYQGRGESAIFTLQASHDMTAWMPVATYTVTASQQATAQISAFYPYLRVAVTNVYSGGGNTGILDVFYAPGVK